MIEVKATEQQQQEAVLHINATFLEYKNLLQPYYDRLLAVYKELNTFTYPKKADWSTTFKVNKMFEISNKITPRIVSKNPKWIVNYKPDLITKQGKEVDMGKLQMQTTAVQDLLSTIFEKYNLQEALRLRAKGMVNY